LHEEHGISLSYSWIKAALQTAGLVTRRRVKRSAGKLEGAISQPASGPLLVALEAVEAAALWKGKN
jgi:hypothetical protein